jgi:serine/threonine protein kinase
MGERVVEGDVLAGKYRVEKVLGSGGMGVVVAARHVQLDVLVALKFMTDEALADAELARRFLREARAAARLRSEHVARVSDVGTLESGAPYLVMEYLEGSDLAELLSNTGPQPIGSAVEFIAQACDALEEAHRAGIVHRDVKPSNLFLTTRPNGTPCIKVLDFGISKVERLGSSTAKLYSTQPRSLLGSPFYMAPEQMRAARDVDARADIWALGATLYELLTGRLPFEAESLLDLAFRVANSEPTAPREMRPEIPWVLEQIVVRCLQKDPDDRFASAAALAGALAEFMPRRGRARRAPAKTAWPEDSAPESNSDVVTRIVVADARSEGVVESAVQPLEASTSPAPSPADASRTLPVVASAQWSSVPPVEQSGTRGFRTGAKLSWGRSYRLLGKNPRVALGAFVVGLFASAGAVSAFMLRSQSPHRLIDLNPVASAVAAPSAPALGGGVTGPADLKASPPPAPPLDSSSRIPTFEVTDLPSQAVPDLPRSLPRAALTPAPSSVTPTPSARPSCEKPSYVDERGHVKFKPECLDSAPVESAAPVPKPEPADEIEKNPYLSPP